MKVSYSAPIGIVLSGERSALYGKPVLIAASDLRVTCLISESNEIVNQTELMKLIDHQVTTFLEKNKTSFTKKKWLFEHRSNVTFDESPSYLAAFIVSSVAALLEFYTGKEYEKEVINKIAFQIEKEYFHLSLGFYTSCSTFGGILYFRKEFEFLKSISKLNFKLPKNIEDNLFLVYSNVSKEAVFEERERIKKMYNADSKQMDQYFSQMEKNTKRLVVAIAQENEELFEKTFRDEQKLQNDEELRGSGLGFQFIYLKENKELQKKVKKFRLDEMGLLKN